MEWSGFAALSSAIVNSPTSKNPSSNSAVAASAPLK